jgi:prophage regulatory protein
MSQATFRAARPKHAAEILGVGVSTVWRWVKERHDFPQPRRLSARCTVFDLDALVEWRNAQGKAAK